MAGSSTLLVMPVPCSLRRVLTAATFIMIVCMSAVPSMTTMTHVAALMLQFGRMGVALVALVIVIELMPMWSLGTVVLVAVVVLVGPCFVLESSPPLGTVDLPHLCDIQAEIQADCTVRESHRASTRRRVLPLDLLGDLAHLIHAHVNGTTV